MFLPAGERPPLALGCVHHKHRLTHIHTKHTQTHSTHSKHKLTDKHTYTCDKTRAWAVKSEYQEKYTTILYIHTFFNVFVE